MATKKLKLQILDNLKELIWSMIVLGIILYGGIQVFLHGPGNRSKPTNTMSGSIKQLLYWLEDTGHKNLVVGILLIASSVLALIYLFLTIYHLSYLTPKRSILGRSILAQTSQYEAFGDLLQIIDNDLDMETKKFGTELVVGTQWLLSEQVMRIANIERVYVGERKIEHKKQAILLIIDKNGNKMETIFSWDENRDKALQHLQNIISNLYVGDLTEVN